MTNNEIVIWVYNNVDIDRFIKKVIDRTYMEKTNEDLKQYIYMKLLEYDNTKLNDLYNNKVLSQFIMGMILNQRNYYKSYYNKYLRYNDFDISELEIDIEEEEYDIERDKKIEFISKELTKYRGKRKKLTKEQEDEMIRLQFYYIYIKRGVTLIELSKRLDMNYRTVLRIIRSAKEIIKSNYFKK